MVVEGSKAPPFDLEADEGGRIRLGDLEGRNVVLYFYPKDDTSGCTLEACDFRDSLPRFDAGNAVVLGVSPDSVASHVRFKAKYGLTFPLLSDPDHAVCEAYGAWKEKSMYGRKYFGVERSTFLLDGHGNVSKVWRRVQPKGHADEVAAALTKGG